MNLGKRIGKHESDSTSDSGLDPATPVDPAENAAHKPTDQLKLSPRDGRSAGNQSLTVGQKFGQFTLLEPMGGKMGSVFRALDGISTRELAIKIFDHSPQSDALFEKEVRACPTPRIDGLIPVQHVGRDSETGRPYLTMPLVKGLNLRDWRWTSSPKPEQCVSVFIRLTEIVASLHRSRIIHADLKPENVMIHEKGEVNLLDHGLMSRLGEEPAAEIDGKIYGSCGFYGNERLEMAVAHPTADVFSLGKILEFLAHGRLLDAQDSIHQCSVSAKERAFRRKTEIISKLATAPNPNDRPENATALLALSRKHLRTKPSRPLSLKIGLLVIVLCALSLVLFSLYRESGTLAMSDFQGLSESIHSPTEDARKELPSALFDYKAGSLEDLEKLANRLIKQTPIDDMQGWVLLSPSMRTQSSNLAVHWEDLSGRLLQTSIESGQHLLIPADSSAIFAVEVINDLGQSDILNINVKSAQITKTELPALASGSTFF